MIAVHCDICDKKSKEHEFVQRNLTFCDLCDKKV